MGWNSWNTFGADINEKLIFETADRMADGGLLSHGYEYLVIDDCWSLKTRDSDGRLVPDRKISARDEKPLPIMCIQRT